MPPDLALQSPGRARHDAAANGERGYADALAVAAARTPHHPALEDERGVLSYARLDAAVGAMAAGLVHLGAGPETVAALVAHPDLSGVQAVHAVPRTGAVLAPVNPRLGPVGVREALDALRPTMVIATADAAGETGLDPERVILLDRIPRGIGLPRAGGAPGGYRLCTSGTSGSATTVDLAPAQLAASARAVSRRLGLGSADRWYASLSVAHVGGLALVHRCAWLGATLVAKGRFSTAELVQLIASGRVTHASLVPAQLGLLLDAFDGAPLPASLRCLVIGGDGIGDGLFRRAMAAGAPLALTYGLTEAASQAAAAPPETVRAHGITAGAPLDGVELTIAGADDSGAGEILLRGPTVPLAVRAPDGWLHTGDLGRLDEHGMLRVTGRAASRIVSAGTNVDPARVERAVASLPGVSEVAVVGIPDAVWGERVVAVVVPAPGAALHAAALVRDARGLLGAAQRPREVRLVEQIPRNANGKVDRAALRRLFTAP